MSSGPSAVEQAPGSLYVQPDEETVAAYRLALELHEGRYRILPRIVTQLPPAPGVDPAPFVVPGGAVWIPLTWFGTLVSSATVASRVPQLSFDDTNTLFYRQGTVTAYTASTTALVSFARQLGDHASTLFGSEANTMPHMPLPANFRAFVFTANIQAGDQWTALAMYVLEISGRGLAERAREFESLARGEQAELYPGLTLGL